jgi:uncharacterized membrane protein HdeD (DUF308 family)
MNLQDEGRALFRQEEQKLAEQFQRLKERFEMSEEELEVIDRLIRKAQMAEAKMRGTYEGEHPPPILESTTIATEPAAAPNPQQTHTRWWFGTLGLVLILLGVLGLVSVSVLRFLTTLVLGPMLLASGIMHLLMAFFAQRWRGAPLHLTAAVLDTVVGFLVMIHPISAVDDLLLVLAALLMIGGVYRVVSSLLLRFPAWRWTLTAGVVAVLLGLFVWKEGPFHGLWLAGLCVTVDFICHGVSWLILAHIIRNPTPLANLPGFQQFHAAGNA